jgi:tRNA-Thr(GGU) m(6)t(6)A37 methyltransferase TsaA
MMKDNQYMIKPVGMVKNENYQFSLEIFPEYQSALKELEGFSHIQAMFWFHFADTEEYRSILTSEKPYKNAPDEIGIFATRSPMRPNPIALSVIEIISVDIESGSIQIGYTDADDQTPIIDIKPYHPATDRVKNVTVPEWCSHWPQYYEENESFDWQGEFVNA